MARCRLELADRRCRDHCSRVSFRDACRHRLSQQHVPFRRAIMAIRFAMIVPLIHAQSAGLYFSTAALPAKETYVRRPSAHRGLGHPVVIIIPHGATLVALNPLTDARRARTWCQNPNHDLPFGLQMPLILPGVISGWAVPPSSPSFDEVRCGPFCRLWPVRKTAAVANGCTGLAQQIAHILAWQRSSGDLDLPGDVVESAAPPARKTPCVACHHAELLQMVKNPRRRPLTGPHGPAHFLLRQTIPRGQR